MTSNSRARSGYLRVQQSVDVESVGDDSRLYVVVVVVVGEVSVVVVRMGLLRVVDVVVVVEVDVVSDASRSVGLMVV
jgi:hypothetical protein